MNDIELAQLLAAKIGHDLSGSMGAVWSSTEYLDHSNIDMRKTATELIKTSSANATNALKFFRATYGSSNDVGEAHLEELTLIAKEFLRGHNIALEFHKQYSHNPEVFICVSTGKLILSMILAASMTLLHGGLITVTIEKADHKKKVTIVATGKKIKIREGNHDILMGKPSSEGIQVRDIHHFYTARLIEQLGMTLKIHTLSERLEYVMEGYSKTACSAKPRHA